MPQMVRSIDIVLLTLGMVASIGMMVGLISKLRKQTGQKPRYNYINHLLLIIAIADCISSAIKVGFKIYDIMMDAELRELKYDIGTPKDKSFWILHTSFMLFDISLLWESVLMIQIAMLSDPKALAAPFKLWKAWLVILLIVSIRFAVNLVYPYEQGRYYGGALFIGVGMLNFGVLAYLFYQFIVSTWTTRRRRIITRSLLFPICYLLLIIPQCIVFFAKRLNIVDWDHHHIAFKAADHLFYAYIFVHCSLYSLSQRCFQTTKKDEQLERVSGIIDAESVKYDLNNVIGSGAMGVVYFGHYRGAAVAIKRIRVPLRENDTNGNISFTAQADFYEEAQLLQRLIHPNIVYFMGAFIKEREGHIVCEYCDSGDLQSVLDHFRATPKQATWEWRYKIALGIAQGLNYLHETATPQIIHRDLKSLNVLIQDSFTAKLADFGTAKLISTIMPLDERSQEHEGAASTLMTTQIGSARWTAPEVSKNYRTGVGHYTKAIDIYSLGMVLYEILSLDLPFANLRFNHQVLEAVDQGQRPNIQVYKSQASPEFLHLIEQCWAQDPALRPKSYTIVNKLNILYEQEQCRLHGARNIPAAVDSDHYIAIEDH